MDKMLMAKLGIKPILKRKSYNLSKVDIRIFMSEILDKKSGETRTRAIMNISPKAYKKAFGYDYICFGFAKDVGRLYFWEAENTSDGFKISHKGSPDPHSNAAYTVQSTDLHKAISCCVSGAQNYEYEVKYSSDLGCWYIEVSNPIRRY